MAVVSIRMTGELLAELDRERSYYSRSMAMSRALRKWFALPEHER